jgi:hypothetical protein
VSLRRDEVAVRFDLFEACSSGVIVAPFSIRGEKEVFRINFKDACENEFRFVSFFQKKYVSFDVFVVNKFTLRYEIMGCNVVDVL